METFETLLKKNRRYIHTIINKLYKTENLEERKDLQQIGYLSYWTAFQTYDPTKNKSLNTYASTIIKNNIIQYLAQNGNTVKITRTTRKKEGENLKKIISLDETIKEDDPTTLADTISTDEYWTNDYDNTTDVKLDVLKHYFIQLNDRHQKLLSMRYIEEKTLKEIGIEFGISVEAVRQQIETALSKIRALIGIQVDEKKYQRVKPQSTKKVESLK